MTISGLGSGASINSSKAEAQAHSIMPDPPISSILQPFWEKLVATMKKLDHELPKPQG
ncbi:MAG: hypothetical protein U0457_00215 [Candidatus Sericytochromatia bacterium]